MAHVQRFDHVGITVADLGPATEFFVGLGLEVEGTESVQGEFVENRLRHPGRALRDRDAAVPRRDPARAHALRHPHHVPGSPAAMANELGMRNVSFEVGDLQAAVDAVTASGYGLVGGIGQHEGRVRMAYVRGPEGIIMSLFEQMG